MMAIVCALMSGVTIVFSRTINGCLAHKTDAYQSTFFNYLTGFIMSFIIVFILPKETINEAINPNFTILLGGILGVFNVLLLNIIIHKISPIQLTLVSFIAQLISGMFIDYCFYGIFTLTKLIGCVIVIIGLIIFQKPKKIDNKLFFKDTTNN